MPDFTNLLSRKVESAERPKPKAPGTYFGQIIKYEFGESPKKKTPYVEYTLGSITPGPDVDMNYNNENGIDLAKWAPRFQFYLTEDAIYRLRELMEGCQLDIRGRSFNETIPEMKGKPVKFVAKNNTSDDGKAVYTNADELSGA